MCLRYEIHQSSVIGGMKLQVYEEINLFMTQNNQILAVKSSIKNDEF